MREFLEKLKAIPAQQRVSLVGEAVLLPEDILVNAAFGPRHGIRLRAIEALKHRERLKPSSLLRLAGIVEKHSSDDCAALAVECLTRHGDCQSTERLAAFISRASRDQHMLERQALALSALHGTRFRSGQAALFNLADGPHRYIQQRDECLDEMAARHLNPCHDLSVFEEAIVTRIRLENSRIENLGREGSAAGTGNESLVWPYHLDSYRLLENMLHVVSGRSEISFRMESLSLLLGHPRRYRAVSAAGLAAAHLEDSLLKHCSAALSTGPADSVTSQMTAHLRSEKTLVPVRMALVEALRPSESERARRLLGEISQGRYKAGRELQLLAAGVVNGEPSPQPSAG